MNTDNIPQEVMEKIEDEPSKIYKQNTLSSAACRGAYRAGAIFGYSLRDEEVDELKKSIGEWTNQHFRDKKTYKEQLQQKEARIKELEEGLQEIANLDMNWQAAHIAQQLLNKQKQSE